MKFNRFLSRIDQMDMVRKYSERINTLCGITLPDLTDTPYGVLRHEVPADFEAGEFNAAITKLLWSGKVGRVRRFKRLRRKILALRVRYANNYAKLKFIFWVEDSYRALEQLELTYLVSDPDPKMVAAGVHELDILGDKNLIDMMAGGDVLKWDEVVKLPYSRVFDKQLKNVIDARIARKLNKMS